MEKTIITSEMIESLYGMLISSSIEDRNVAMGILNNRDLKDETSEKNVEILTDKVLTKNYGENWLRIKRMKKGSILEGINNQLKVIARIPLTNENY